MKIIKKFLILSLCVFCIVSCEERESSTDPNRAVKYLLYTFIPGSDAYMLEVSLDSPYWVHHLRDGGSVVAAFPANSWRFNGVVYAFRCWRIGSPHFGRLFVWVEGYSGSASARFSEAYLNDSQIDQMSADLLGHQALMVSSFKSIILVYLKNEMQISRLQEARAYAKSADYQLKDDESEEFLRRIKLMQLIMIN